MANQDERLQRMMQLERHQQLVGGGGGHFLTYISDLEVSQSKHLLTCLSSALTVDSGFIPWHHTEGCCQSVCVCVCVWGGWGNENGWRFVSLLDPLLYLRVVSYLSALLLLIIVFLPDVKQ